MPRVFTHRPFKLGIFGNSGYGKSQYQIRFTLASRARYKFIFDHKGEFAELMGMPPECVASTYEELDACEQSGWFIFNPHRLYPGRVTEAFDYFCDYAWQAAEALSFTKLFVADELALLTEGQKPVPLCRILEDGRSVQLDCCMTSHGPNSLHNRIRTQFTERVSFFQDSGPALEVMEKEFGFDPVKIKALGRGEFIAKSEDGRFQGGKVF